jgi:hypothetical protein
MKKLTIYFTLSLLTFITATIPKEKSNLPRSREATLLESSSPSEVMVRATGYGIDEKHRRPKAEVLDKSANIDAMKTAVWFVLYGGSDPLLQTEDEKNAFKETEEEFFTEGNVKKFIAWEADYYDKRLKIENGKKLKIEKTFRINKSLLQEELIKKGVLPQIADIAGVIGLPTIMVIPESKDDRPPLELLTTDMNLKKAAEVIESYLTARKYQVIVPEQQQILQELIATQYSLAGSEDDYSYLLALSIGCDIYITYNIIIDMRKVGSSTVKKATVGCRAYETTTARLLGTETGYSHERLSPDAVLIEEAMNDAIDKVLSRITNYWKQDIEKGIQYKLIFNISNEYELEEAEEIIFEVADLVKEMAKSFKENTLANYTYDVIIWCDHSKFRSSTDIYKYIKDNYKGNGEIKRVSISRKLILLSII